MTFLVLSILTAVITGGIFYLLASRSENSTPPSSGTSTRSGSSDRTDGTDELKVDVSSTRDREEL